jgi:hypothetical protein
VGCADADGVVRCIGKVADGVSCELLIPLSYRPPFTDDGELLKKRAAVSPSANALARNIAGFSRATRSTSLTIWFVSRS